MAGDQLSPFVYWAQNEKEIFLKVDLRDAENVEVNAEEKQLSFSATGHGAKGENKYTFQLHFYLPIIPNETQYQISGRQVDFHIPKAKPKWWVRLTGQPQKPAWLKVDFDRWKCEDDSEEEPRNIYEDYPKAYDKVHQEEYGYKVESLRKVYLFLYNLFQLVLSLYIMGVMVVRYTKDGDESLPGMYEAVGTAATFNQLFAFLEILHPILGFTSGSVSKSILQVLARSIVLFGMINGEPRMQTKPVVFYLFVAWYSSEIIRYPFYMLQVYKMEIPLLTWFRYTLWIILYPMGFICEGIILLRCIPYFEETLKFSVLLPNALNFSFYLPNIIRIYLLMLFFPGMYTMMSYMSKQRSKKLGSIIRKYK